MSKRWGFPVTTQEPIKVRESNTIYVNVQPNGRFVLEDFLTTLTRTVIIGTTTSPHLYRLISGNIYHEVGTLTQLMVINANGYPVFTCNVASASITQNYPVEIFGEIFLTSGDQITLTLGGANDIASVRCQDLGEYNPNNQ